MLSASLNKHVSLKTTKGMKSADVTTDYFFRFYKKTTELKFAVFFIYLAGLFLCRGVVKHSFILVNK